MIKQLLGKRIKEIRKSKNLTQSKLADLLNIETSSVSNIENGRYFPSAENLDKILQILEISPSEIFKVEHNNNVVDLINEMNLAMKQNEKLARLLYQLYFIIKNYNL